jgi:PAS domain S-box-containing protein
MGADDPSEVIGKTDFDFFPHAQRSFDEEQALMKTVQPLIDLEEYVVWPDGRVTWVSTTKVPLRDQEGQIIGIMGISRDITERKQFEQNIQKLNEELKQYAAQLKESEEKFSKAFLASPAAMSIANAADGRYIDINEAMAEMTGYSREESLGRTSLELGLVDMEARAKILTSGREYGFVRDVEIQIHTRSNQILDVLVSLEQIILNGQTCMLTIQYDITKRKRAEAEVRRLNQELEQRQIALETANKELEAFSYSVSHDLRAPLRSIDGFSMALLEDYSAQLPEKGQNYLMRVRTNAQRMAELIDDLLGLARVTRASVERTPVDLSALAENILGELQHEQPERHVKLLITPGLTAEADASLLRIALTNLLNNAWKFTSKQAEAQIEFGLQEQNGEQIYFVRDNGAGFDMTYVGKLFGAFQRLHAATEFPGTGIGLAIVQRIFHKHGGRVWAEGAVDRGATFYFTLS